MPNFRILNKQPNKIHSICTAFSKLTVSLSVSRRFQKQRRLNSLKITSADLPHLPNDLFEYIPKLRYLDLSDNNLKIVPYPISQLKFVSGFLPFFY